MISFFPSSRPERRRLRQARRGRGSYVAAAITPGIRREICLLSPVAEKVSIVHRAHRCAGQAQARAVPL